MRRAHWGIRNNLKAIVCGICGAVLVCLFVNPYSGEAAEASKAVSPSPSDLEAAKSKYAAIIGFYQDFMREGKEDGDYGEATLNLHSKISNELGGVQSLEKTLNDDFSSSCVELGGAKLGYAIQDLNKDGIPELIILSEEDYPEGDYFVHALYSLKNDKPILLGAYWPRNSCEIDKTGTIYIEASSGAADNYSATYLVAPGSAKLQLVEMVGIETKDDSEQCYRIKNEQKTIVDCKEASEARKDSPGDSDVTKDAGLTFIPLFK